MKKTKAKTFFMVLIIFLGVIIYLATPIRSVLAKMTASHYIHTHYPQYEFTSIELVGIGYHSYHDFEWISRYMVQGINGSQIVYVEMNGWLPMIVQESQAFQLEDGDYFPVGK
ncbi:hypothetical protein [Anaerotignum sp.]|uniref:hypothetical protein n=1 Tax=Anaerotignum sp. TaxID=2039241 RepID=UPI0027146E4B|nr:hypothetical protein [Anaerotignum sp.]